MLYNILFVKPTILVKGSTAAENFPSSDTLTPDGSTGCAIWEVLVEGVHTRLSKPHGGRALWYETHAQVGEAE